jgi:hypothetical protein
VASTKALEQTSCKGREGTSAMGGEEVTDHANVLIVGMLIIVAVYPFSCEQSAVILARTSTLLPLLPTPPPCRCR